MAATKSISGAASPRVTFLALLQFSLVALMAFACVRIVAPFTAVLLWSVILAVMLNPLHLRLSKRLGNRWSATLIGLVSVALILVPMVFLATSLASSLSALVSGLQNNTLTLPQPPPRLADVPLVGQKASDAWALAASNMPAAVAKYGPTLREPLKGLVGAVGGLAAAELSFVLSFAIAAILVAYARLAPPSRRDCSRLSAGAALRSSR
jgi:predicted PurR-regulated permease PerM